MNLCVQKYITKNEKKDIFSYPDYCHAFAFVLSIAQSGLKAGAWDNETGKYLFIAIMRISFSYLLSNRQLAMENSARCAEY